VRRHHLQRLAEDSVSEEKTEVACKHIAYKPCALLHQRSRLPEGAAEILIGDDTETDALAYSLYADVIAGRIKEKELGDIMSREGSDSEEIEAAIEGLKAIKTLGDRVEWITYICQKEKTRRSFWNTATGL